MTMTPKDRESKVLAIGLLLIPLMLIALVMNYTTVLPQQEMNQALDELATIHQRLQRLSQQKQQLIATLADWKQAENGVSENFLAHDTFNLAAADLQAKIKELIWSQDTTGAHCSIVSQQNIEKKSDDQFVPVTVKVKLRCKLAELQNIIYDIETQMPLLIIDALMVSYRGLTAKKERFLDVQFDVTGYLKPHAEKERLGKS